MIASILRSIQGKPAPDALPPVGTFTGKTVVVTGGTSGLGLAAAVHFVNLGADEVVITCRNAPRGEAARAKIEAETGTVGKKRVTVMELDMDRFASVVAFADELKRRYGQKGVDDVVLNAGVFMPTFRQSPQGWEESIQVNTLSTVLLALLLLPWMKASRKQRQSAPHLTFVSSGTHASPDVAEWPRWAEKEGGILAHLNKEENWPNRPIDAMYAISKLLLEYAIREICRLALGPGGEPDVIVSSVCPGPVKTDLPRTVMEQSFLMKIIVPIYSGLRSKSPESGSKVYVAGALTKQEDHGKFIRFYWTDEEYREKAASVMTSKAGKAAQSFVWKEIVGILEEKVPEIREYVTFPTV
ncbi:NAD(P)-binding protein [Pleurostoma richardsiae]|uniref:NAD(P)-binding protein n=1 Tax=Pleurostoma richardsiae TaxID=41990 RepID=A0AA38R440_9PEZI|nr:NAD(P)-binding protein [Pleurostoma richardsiae]